MSMSRRELEELALDNLYDEIPKEVRENCLGFSDDFIVEALRAKIDYFDDINRDASGSWPNDSEQVEEYFNEYGECHKELAVANIEGLCSVSVSPHLNLDGYDALGYFFVYINLGCFGEPLGVDLIAGASGDSLVENAAEVVEYYAKLVLEAFEDYCEERLVEIGEYLRDGELYDKWFPYVGDKPLREMFARCHPVDVLELQDWEIVIHKNVGAKMVRVDAPESFDEAVAEAFGKFHHVCREEEIPVGEWVHETAHISDLAEEYAADYPDLVSTPWWLRATAYMVEKEGDWRTNNGIEDNKTLVRRAYFLAIEKYVKDEIIERLS